MAIYDDARSTWTSFVPSGRVRISPSTRDGVRWHWAGPRVGLFGKTHGACLSQVRSWEAYHRSKDWNSIGYNALICVHARVIEGRGIDYRGAHSGSTDDNASTYGIQFMLGTGESPTTAMYDRAYRLERDLWDHSGHTLFSAGHRDAPGASTECPGDEIHKWAHSTHSLSNPTAPLPEEEDMPITDADAAKIAKAVHERSVQVGNDVEQFGLALGRTRAGVRRIETQTFDYEALATALAPKLPAGTVVDQATLSASLREVLGALDAS